MTMLSLTPLILKLGPNTNQTIRNTLDLINGVVVDLYKHSLGNSKSCKNDSAQWSRKDGKARNIMEPGVC